MKDDNGDESDSSDLPDDYDPDAVTQISCLNKKKSSMKLNAKKTVVFPLKQTAKEK